MDLVDADLRADAIALWERWAHRHHPQDLGDEGGWDESYVEEWLTQLRTIVRQDGDVRPASRERGSVS